MDVDGGLARVTVRVRCERVVPIRGSVDLYKKSAVVVTRRIEIDLTVTDERSATTGSPARRTASRVRARSIVTVKHTHTHTHTHTHLAALCPGLPG